RSWRASPIPNRAIGRAWGSFAWGKLWARIDWKLPAAGDCTLGPVPIAASAASWVQEHRNCIITGPTGIGIIGKSYLACALGHQTCREGLRVQYFYAPKLFRSLESA